MTNHSRLDGTVLLDFVTTKMIMSSYYQPLVIRSLIQAGGCLPRESLARTLLLEDKFATSRALHTLMRWPKSTLTKHGIVEYDRERREFRLPVVFVNDPQRDQVLKVCSTAIERWQQKEASRVASRFFGVIERAGGRCEACGVLGSIRPIDVDHIIPQDRARKGKVTLPDGQRVPVDDIRNLQALCERCNRGKRDTSTYDFRPSKPRLAETISLVLERAVALGFDPEEVLALTTRTPSVNS